MTLASDVTAELRKGATGAGPIAQRLGADEGLVELVLRRLDRDGTLGAPVLADARGAAAASCSTGCGTAHQKPSFGAGCGGCPFSSPAIGSGR